MNGWSWGAYQSIKLVGGYHNKLKFWYILEKVCSFLRWLVRMIITSLE